MLMDCDISDSDPFKCPIHGCELVEGQCWECYRDGKEQVEPKEVDYGRSFSD